jgi:hypothetical protein
MEASSEARRVEKRSTEARSAEVKTQYDSIPEDKKCKTQTTVKDAVSRNS